MDTRFLRSLSALVIILGVSGLAYAQVGEPTSFDITVKQGATIIAQDTVTVGPGQDLEDIKVSDATPPDFTQIATVAPGGVPAPAPPWRKAPRIRR